MDAATDRSLQGEDVNDNIDAADNGSQRGVGAEKNNHTDIEGGKSNGVQPSVQTEGETGTDSKRLSEGISNPAMDDKTCSSDAGVPDQKHSIQGPPEQQRQSSGGFASSAPVVFTRRWFMLGLFCFYSLTNAFQWIHLNIIANLIIKYYNESLPASEFEAETAVDWLSMVYMLGYVPLIFPATWLLNKKGLRVCCILGSFLNALGAWIKCTSVAPDRFAVLMFAQTLCSVAQVFVLGIPARFAAVWFGPNEVSTATSLGVFGNQMGGAIGFLLPPILVPNSDVESEMRDGYYAMFFGTAIVTSLIFVLIVIFFKKCPPEPPSRAQQMAVEAARKEDYGKSLMRLGKNKGFMVLVLAYGINTGSFYAISTLLNPIILHYFADSEEEAGRIGLALVLCGVVGAVTAGVWLDKTKSFKGTTIGIYIMSVAGMVAFTLLFDLDKLWIVYITGGALGFFMTGYLPVGFEFAAELTFPESEGTSSGLLNASAQIFGIVFTLSMRAMMDSVSVLGANFTLCGCLLVGALITAMIKADYRRQKAEKSALTLEVTVPPPDTNNDLENPHIGHM